jgi:hypothetical protein
MLELVSLTTYNVGKVYFIGTVHYAGTAYYTGKVCYVGSSLLYFKILFIEHDRTV